MQHIFLQNHSTPGEGRRIGEGEGEEGECYTPKHNGHVGIGKGGDEAMHF